MDKLSVIPKNDSAYANTIIPIGGRALNLKSRNRFSQGAIEGVTHENTSATIHVSGLEPRAMKVCIHQRERWGALQLLPNKPATGLPQ